jgi:hypothetical protein
MFWGMMNYNEMMLQDGNVQSEMILKKDPREFTLSGGWEGHLQRARVRHALA